MEDQWLKWAKRLQAIASTGLYFSKDDFDRERYREVATIAQSMLGSLGNIPIQRIEGLLSDFAKGYATPKVDVRGAIIEDEKVLLVREKSDGLWTLPGGFADVGLSATENVIKEIREEAGIRASVTGLYAVRHKAKQVYEPDIRDFYKMFFLCRRVDAEPTKPSSEIIDAAFFARHGLPQLSKGASSRVTSKLPLYFMRIQNGQWPLIDFNAGTNPRLANDCSWPDAADLRVAASRQLSGVHRS